MEIPKQLQNSELRFVLLGVWNRWEQVKTKVSDYVEPQNYLKFKEDKEWKPSGKAPYETGWQNKNNYSFDNPRLLSHIKTMNFGVIGGYGRLRILDIDDPQLAEEFEKKLNTYTVKTGSGGRHFYFYSDYDKNHVLVNKQGELRANKYQVVSAPCRHPSGNYYTIINDSPIQEISEGDLLKLIKPYLREEKEATTSIKTEDKKKEGFVGIKVTNKEVFADIEKIVEKNNLIVYNGSVKQYKIYHITTGKPDKISNLKLTGASIKEATITGIAVFSDKIVCLLDNKKHITIAEGEEVKNVLDNNKTEFDKLIGIKLLFGEEEIIEKIQSSKKGKDPSRSGRDMKEVCRLVYNGSTKEQVFEEMEYSAKWSSSPEQYKELTYKKAVAWVEKKKSEKPTFEEATGLKNTDLKTFIFDKNEVIQNKVFTSQLIGDSIFGFGMLLPRTEDRKDSKGNILYSYQAWRGVIMTSTQRGLVVSEWLKKEHKIDFDCVPSEMRLRWELEDIRKYLDGKAEQVKGKELFNLIKEQYEYYNFYREKNWYSVNSLWDIGTYLHQLFSAFPLKENRGLAGTGKTKSMVVSSCITLNGTDIMTNPSESTLFRETEALRPTKYIDEAEKLFKITKVGMEADNRVELINASYTRNGSVPRQEKLGKGYVTKWYHVYSPTQISSINGLFGATESRALTQIHTKSPDADIRGERDPEDDRSHPKWKEIRNKCYLWALQNWKQVYDCYLNFDIKTTLKKRDLQLWKPLLVLAEIIDKVKLLPEILQFAERMANQRKDDYLSEGSLDYKLLSCVNELLKRGVTDDKLFVNDIRLEYNDKFKSNEPTDSNYNRTVSNRLDKLGFKDLRYKDHKVGSYYLLTHKVFEEVVNPITSDFSSQQSQSSQDKGKDKKLYDEEGTKEDDNNIINDNNTNFDKLDLGTKGTEKDERDDSLELTPFDKDNIEVVKI